jgi:hypothetical protein
VRKITRVDDDNNVYESNADIGDVYDELESVTTQLSRLNERLESTKDYMSLFGGLILIILLVQTIRHW